MSEILVPQPVQQKAFRARVLSEGCIDEKTYEVDSSFRPYNPSDPMTVHTTAELLHCLENKPEIELESRILCASNAKGIHSRKLSKKQFQESFKNPLPKRIERIRESDFFATDGNPFGGGIGNDFVPLLGGPFYKNQYYYEDYIRMHAQAFYAYHHDPIARAIVHITRDFVLGTGFEIQCDTIDQRGKLAMAVWKAFEEANDLQQQVEDACNESSIYGETMWWELPGNQTKITYNLPIGEKPPTGYIPRVRLLDPSNLIEIVTYPEDITRRLFYVWLTPTQYQIYSGTGNGGTPPQPAMKFIYQHIPANQILHFKLNSVSNEKRGRSDLFPVLGYLKRLRDSVEYTIVGLQKVSAWSIDTEIDGSQSDIDMYVANQRAMGTLPPPGSEWVHSKAIKRAYSGNEHGSAHTSDAFQWVMSMIAAGVQIPISYFGMHLSGGTTRASAIVGTEPVAKKMEKRREYMSRMIKKLWSLAQRRAGLPDIDCNIIFPEIITQDRSAKLKDLLLCEEARWIKPERAATIAAKELQIKNFDYNSELQDMKAQLPEVPKPLVDPGQENNPDGDEPEPEGALTSGDRKDIKQNDSSL